jgi:HlyD family secretion protein
MTPQQTLLRRLALGAAALLLMGAVTYVSLRTGPLAPIKVTVTQAKEGSLSPAIFGIGTVEAQRAWLVGPTTAGRVLSVKVDVGERVKSGQLLAEMDPVDLDQRLAALDASLARAGSAQTSVQAQVADASARRALATANTQRNQDLARQNFISAGALEAKLQEQASANAAVQAAQANLSGAGQDLLPPEGRTRRVGAAAWQCTTAGPSRCGGDQPRRRGRQHRGGRPAGAAPGGPGQPVGQAAGGPGPLAGLQTGLPASIVLRSDNPANARRPGATGGIAGRRRDRRAHRPGGV